MKSLIRLCSLGCVPQNHSVRLWGLKEKQKLACCSVMLCSWSHIELEPQQRSHHVHRLHAEFLLHCRTGRVCKTLRLMWSTELSFCADWIPPLSVHSASVVFINLFFWVSTVLLLSSAFTASQPQEETALLKSVPRPPEWKDLKPFLQPTNLTESSEYFGFFWTCFCKWIFSVAKSFSSTAKSSVCHYF